MPKKKIFISCRINEMRTFREEAVAAILAAGMEPAFFDSTDADKRWPLKPGLSQMDQLLEAVRTSDAFLGIYGQTLNTNWIPPGSNSHSMELEFEEARKRTMPCFLYMTRPSALDRDMEVFRQRLLATYVDYVDSPRQLGADLAEKLELLTPRTFLSYSSKDQAFVDSLFARLRSSGHYAWLNTESIPKGENWLAEMRSALQTTKVLILVVSPESMASKWVKEEWKTFLASNKQILPILHRETKVPRSLSKIEMIKTDHKDWETKLLRAIEQGLASSGGET